MTEAALHIVVYHTNGHAIWLAPWLADTWVAGLALYVFLAVLGWMLRDR